MRAILFLTVSPLPGEKGMWLGTVGGGGFVSHSQLS